jgi:hypothetical protein
MNIIGWYIYAKSICLFALSEHMTNDELLLPNSFNNATLEIKMPVYITDGA